tara:strand:+ start:1473 stop:2558 length:1086 start_codon:yes stop_codon:yes gene_type:complete
MKVYELTKKDWLETSVFRIALVENPAIEENFIFLSKDKPVFLSVNEEKRMIYSPVLIPDKEILRMSDDGEPYNIVFRAETIQEIAQDYMTKKTTLSEWNLEHNPNITLKGVTVVENWIIKDSENGDHIALGFKGLPKGTWMQGVKITDDSVWKLVKEGKVKGVSIEADMNHILINQKQVEMSETNKRLDSIMTMLNKVLPKKDIKLASLEVGDGSMVYAESFEEGSLVFIDEAMTVPFEGSFEKDGKAYTVEAGVLVATSEIEEMKDEEIGKTVESLTDIAESQAAATNKLGAELEANKAESAKKIEELTNTIQELSRVMESHKVLLAKVSKQEPKSSIQLGVEISAPSKFNDLRNKANLK